MVRQHEVLLKDLPPDVFMIDIHEIKKNGPKKGQPKVRVCLHGGQMKMGEHYERSHSPAIMAASLRAMIGVAASRRMKIYGGDFVQAFLNADAMLVYGWPPKSARQYDENDNRIVWAVP